MSVLRFGIAADAVAYVRSELEAIVNRYAGEPARELREVSVMLRRARDAWTHGAHVSVPAPDRDGALREVARRVEAARPDDPQDLFAVSLLVASRGERIAPSATPGAEDLAAALDALTYRDAAEIAAVELVWGMTGALALHPLGATSIGKVFCRFCGAPFPAELVSCPRCGGPAPGRGA